MKSHSSSTSLDIKTFAPSFAIAGDIRIIRKRLQTFVILACLCGQILFSKQFVFQNYIDLRVLCHADDLKINTDFQ